MSSAPANSKIFFTIIFFTIFFYFLTTSQADMIKLIGSKRHGNLVSMTEESVFFLSGCNVDRDPNEFLWKEIIVLTFNDKCIGSSNKEGGPHGGGIIRGECEPGANKVEGFHLDFVGLRGKVPVLSKKVTIVNERAEIHLFDKDRGIKVFSGPIDKILSIRMFNFCQNGLLETSGWLPPEFSEKAVQ